MASFSIFMASALSTKLESMIFLFLHLLSYMSFFIIVGTLIPCVPSAKPSKPTQVSGTLSSLFNYY